MTSVSASRNELRLAWRSSASSAQTGVNANGWKTRRTLRLPRKSCKRRRGLSYASSRSKSGARSPVAIAIRALLSVAGRNIVGPALEALGKVIREGAGRVLVRGDVTLPVAAGAGRGVVG